MHIAGDLLGIGGIILDVLAVLQPQSQRVGRLKAVLLDNAQLQTGTQDLQPVQLGHTLGDPVEAGTEHNGLAGGQLDAQLLGKTLPLLGQLLALHGGEVRLLIALAAQDGGIMALAQQLVGPEAEGMVVRGGEPGSIHDFRLEIGVALQESRQGHLVLLGGKGAGGVHQTAAGADQLGAVVEDLRLTAGAHLHGLLAPVGDGGLFLAEHALAGAGGVDEDPVEFAGEPLGQDGGVFVGHQAVGHGHALHVPGEDLGALGAPLVAQEEALAHHAACDLGSLAAGCGAEVADALAGLGVQQGHGGHGAGLLQIVYAGLVEGVQAGTAVGIIVIAQGLPGHRIAHEGKLRGVTLQGIEPQSHRPGAFQTGQVVLELIPQLGLHSRQKCFRQHNVPP